VAEETAGLTAEKNECTCVKTILGRWIVANKWDDRKKAQENEYFVKKERELLAKLKEKQESEAKASLKTTCHLRCPKCGEPLKERSFQKIVVDQCTGCHGIWLDAGEIETVTGREGSGWLNKFWQKNA
jgi:hypothetical protein